MHYCQIHCDSVVKMLVSVSIAAGFHHILAWSINVVEERYSLVDLYTGSRDGSIEVLSISRELPFQVS